MKAISVNQPWAWLIVNGLKDIENRSWPTNYRGTVLIHAGKKFDEDFDYSFWEGIAGTTVPIVPFQGGIIGQVDIIDCVEESDSPWFFGRYGFVLANAKQFYNPRPCKGALGFFEPDYNSRYATPKRKQQQQGSLL